MQLQQTQRHNVKLRLGISGASGFGKTYSALQLAYGMTNDWSKIAVIDTENASASLYSDLGNFNVLNLSAPYTPERYVEAIDICEKAKQLFVSYNYEKHSNALRKLLKHTINQEQFSHLVGMKFI